MPRAKTEAAAYLDAYKLVTEKKRLEQELAGLEQRRDRILQRLSALDSHINRLECTAQQLRQNNHQFLRGYTSAANSALPQAFDTLFLNY